MSRSKDGSRRLLRVRLKRLGVFLRDLEHDLSKVNRELEKANEEEAKIPEPGPSRIARLAKAALSLGLGSGS